MEWIKKSIMEKSKLPKLLNFKENDINWKLCDEKASKSLLIEICKEYNKTKDTNILSKKYQLHITTIYRYLNKGNKLKLCNFNGNENSKKNLITNRREVICLNTKEIFPSIFKAKIKHNATNIGACCRGERKYSGILNNKDYLQWQYYDEYIFIPKKLYTNKEINKQILNNIKTGNKNKKTFKKGIKIICINTEEIFNKMIDAQNKYKTKHICNCCKNKRPFAGKHIKTREPLKWMYYKDWEALTEEEKENKLKECGIK
jgi:hypothetical protein